MCLRRCKECGKYCEVHKLNTYFSCNECKQNKLNNMLKEKTHNVCKRCNKQWYGKIDTYKHLKLNYKILKPTSIHVTENREKCFDDLNKQLSDVL